jgi:nitrile hydratase accessory protein
MTGSDHVRFDELWQAQAWVLAHALAERGLFSLAEWSDALGAAIKSRGTDDGARYYDAVLEALETLIVRKGAASPADLEQMKEAWREAYETTPHGRPVALKQDPL